MVKKIPSAKSTPKSKISKPQSLRALMVEDSEDDALLIIRELKKGGYDPVSERVETAAAMKKALKEKQWDIILCDYKLPKFNAPSAIALLKESNIDIPLIIVSGTIGEETAVECMRLGAQDYIMKNNLSRLCPAIARELKEAETRDKQKRAEEIIIHSEKRFKALYQESPIPTFTWQKRGDDFFLVDCNRAAILLTEGRASNYMGKSAQELYRERPEIIEDMLQCFKEQSTISKELVSQHFVPGRLLSVYYSYVPPDLIIVHMEDITERKQAEEALRESEERYRRIVDNSLMGIGISCENKIIFANPALLRLFGYNDLEEFTKIPLLNHVAPASHELIAARMEKIAQGKPVPDEFEYDIIRKDGLSRTLLANSQRFTLSGKVHTQTIFQDITERKRSEERYQTIIFTAMDGFGLLDMQGCYKDVNEAYCKMLGYSRNELLTMAIPDLEVIETPENTGEHIRKIMEVGYDRFETRQRRKDGEIIDIEVSVKFEPTDGGRMIGFYRDITERKQAEKALHESEERMKSVFRVAPIGIGLLVNRVFIDVNDRISEMTGYSKEELIGVSARVLYPSQADFDYVGTEKYRQIAQEGTGAVETRWQKKDGKIIDILLSSSPLDSSDLSRGVTFTALDITERKQSREILQQSEEKYRLTFASTSDVIFTLDAELKIMNITPSIEKVLGYKVEELINKFFPDLNIMTPESLEKAIHNTRQSFSGENIPAAVYEFIHHNGEKVVGEITASPIVMESKIIGVTCVARDITERMLAAAALTKSEEKYRSIVENAREGIYQSTDRYLTLNPALAHMLGYDSPEEVLATITDLARQLYVNPDDRKKLLEMVNERGSVTDFEAEYYKKDGSRIWVSINMHAVRDDQGHLLYYQGINQDITEKKKIEAERQENIERLRKSLGATINAMATTVETRDPYTAGHQRRVADLARAIATEMNLESDQIDGVRMASMIHDIGKISIPSEILTKPTELTKLEFNLIKTHPDSGYNILKDIEFPWPIARIVLEHHERIDGSGYPNGLKGEQTLLESRIIAIADVVEAISSHRPYRAAQGLNAALAEISKNKGILYEPDIVDACLRLFREKNYKLAA